MFKFLKIIIIFLSFTVANISYGQNISLQLTVTDSLNSSINDAFVEIKNTNGIVETLQTNSYGKISTKLPVGVYQLYINHINYKSFYKQITLSQNTHEI